MAELSDAVSQILEQKAVTKEPELKTDYMIDWLLNAIHLHLSAKLEPPNITFNGEVGLGANSGVMDRLTELSFMSAYLDDRRGTTKKVHSYHERHNNASPKKQIMNELLIPSLNFIIAGAMPAAFTTILSSYPSIASSLGINTSQQGMVWGTGAFGATVAIGYYAVKFARNPKRIAHRTRDILGREEIITDEIVLYGDDANDEEQRYSGKQVIYRLSSKKNSKNSSEKDSLGLRLQKWYKKHTREPLFKVSISDSATPYTIWLLNLNLKIGEYQTILNIQKSFRYGMRSALTESTKDGSWCRFEYSFDEAKSRIESKLI